jgi:small subunit ribosomal protein S6
MADQAPLYDLMLVLSTAVEDDRRAKILSDVQAQIAGGGGSVQRNDDWRARPLAYEIRHQSEGEYHLLQFTGPPALIEAVSHSLRIDDAVLRFRVIKVLPGTPPPPDTAPPPVGAPAERAPTERGYADRGPGERGPAERGPAERAPVERAPAEA